MKRFFIILTILSLCLSACELKWNAGTEGEQEPVEVKRYDRIESRYLTTGDFTALQEMETEYPMETRTLIENVLKVGSVNDPEISKKFLSYFQDSTLQVLISDVQSEFAKMDDINLQLKHAFTRLKEQIPNLEVPLVYAQITSLDQSIVVGDHSIGISLEKYLGSDYPLYSSPMCGYTQQQRNTMNRQFIVPDLVSFYLMSLFPLKGFENRSQFDRDIHMGKLMWVANFVLEKPVFHNEFVERVDRFMLKNKNISINQLLEMTDYSGFS